MFSKKLSKEEERELTFDLYDLRQAVNKLKKDCQILKNTPGELFIKKMIASLKAKYENSREKLILANTRLAKHVAASFAFKLGCDSGMRLDVHDLFSEGLIGLQLAADRYNPHQINKFSIYGAYWIKQRIQRCIQRNSSIVYVPLYVRTKIRQFKQLERAEDFTDKEIEDKLSMSMEKLAHTLNIIYPRCVRLDHPIGEEDGLPASEMVADSRFTPESIAENRDMLDKMVRTMEIIFSVLKPRELEVIRKRIGCDEEKKTLQEIGDERSLTRERIRQIEKRAWCRIRKRASQMTREKQVVPHPELLQIIASQPDGKLIKFFATLYSLRDEWGR